MAINLDDRKIALLSIIGVVGLAVACVGGYFAYTQLINPPRVVIYRPLVQAQVEPGPAPVVEPEPSPNAPVGTVGAIAPRPQATQLAPRKEATPKTPPRVTSPPPSARATQTSPSEMSARIVSDPMRSREAVTIVPADVIYGPDDRDVIPPVMVNAQLGNQRLSESPDRVVKVELVVDSEGGVESVYIVPDASATLSDAMLSTFALHTIRSWKFQPATKFGIPVRYRQRLSLKGGKQVAQP